MSKAKNKEILIENLHQIKQLGYDSHKLLKDQNNRLLGQVLTEQWKKSSKGQNPNIIFMLMD